jgi:hypothetical protein
MLGIQYLQIKRKEMTKKWLLSSIVLLGLSTQVQATPIFAAQYKMKCNACHNMMPALNKTGLKFLRNGFRFSTKDKTMAEAFLDANSSETRVLPVHGLVGVNADTKNRSDVEKVNLYFGGTMTDTLSLFAVTRSTYNKAKNHNLFGESNSRAYVQWNPTKNKQVIKVGWMDPLSMFSNLNRTLMDNALMGSGLLKKAPKTILKPDWAVAKPLPPKPGEDATAKEIKQYEMAIMPKQAYMLPVSYAGTSLVKGLEYSYLYDNKVMFLVNYGIPSAQFYADDNDMELTTGIEFKDVGGYNFGLVYMHQELANIETDSYILPIEKEFFKGQLLFQQSFVYKDTNQFANPYYGAQTTCTYEIDDVSQVRAIASFDHDEAKSFNGGYSITYSRLWKERYLVHITGARHKSAYFDESITKLSLYLFL